MFNSVTVVADGVFNTVLIGVYAGGKLPRGIGSLNRGRAIESAMERQKFVGAAGSIAEAHVGAKQVICFGLGPKASGDWQSGLSAALRRLALRQLDEATIIAERIDTDAIGLVAGLMSWNYARFKGSAAKSKTLLDLKLGIKSFDHSGFDRGLELAKCINLSRDLSMTPPNVASPAYIAELAAGMAKEVGLNCKVFKGADLEKERFAGLINVGKASEIAPCMIRLEYKPKGATGKPLVLVGKTMTYDTGGLSLKISGSMVGMKQDKDGGCAVLGAMRAVATVYKPNRPVVALLCVAENSVSANAYRPDDVIEFRNGVTVEVTNTDAEGRLVLADGLCYAYDQEDPEAVVDIATLTGGVVTALGKVYGGMFCEDDKLRGALEKLSKQTGEKLWRLPLHDDYREMMRSPIADILNSNSNRQAHPVQGAAFLSFFVKDTAPWAHLDIAGVHDLDKDAGPYCKGPSGFGVQALGRLADAL